MKNKEVNDNLLTYISLFSSAGIGCYGFKQEGFECIATCEFLEKRLNIQKANHKCKYDSGYILGDLTKNEVYEKIFYEIKKWNLKSNVDVVIATPPCQGMSVANQKKKNELGRNSLVVKAIELIMEIKPKIFVFENVSRFLKSICTGIDKKERTINEEIERNLSNEYLFNSKIINFKNFGSNSSRTRTLVIGVKKEYLNTYAPFELFPTYQKEKTLRDVIGKFKPLNKMDEFDEKNILHHFKSYDEKYIPWIENLNEGQSAFENKEDFRIPHKVVNGKLVKHIDTFGDKYKRQIWDKVAPCIHTANDCLASQNTIHPKDNRVFSIAELMEMMTIPKSFKWDNINLSKLSKDESLEWLRKNQLNIRQCIGEAVPTNIFRQIAKNIKKQTNNNIYEKIKKYEYSNPEKNSHAAYFTDKNNTSYIYNILPEFKKDEINILEPSVGGGSFIEPILRKYENIKKVNFYINDISKRSITFCKKIITELKPNGNFKFIYSNKDFLDFNSNINFDLVIGNPPFKKIDKKEWNNLFEEFWIKSLKISKNIIFINPKYIIQSTNYDAIRKVLVKENINNVIDFGELGFEDAKIETVALSISNKKNNNVTIISVPRNTKEIKNKEYIFDNKMPYWLIYRNKQFDSVYKKMRKDIFTIQKNYELSNSKMSSSKGYSDFWIIRSKNIDINEPKTINIKNYDRYASKEIVKATNFYKYISSSKAELFLIPTLTYYPRMIRMPKNTFVNGSVLIAELKDPCIVISDNDIKYFYSKEFRDFYRIAFNYSTRTLNIDKNTIKLFGVIR